MQVFECWHTFAITTKMTFSATTTNLIRKWGQFTIVGSKIFSVKTQDFYHWQQIEFFPWNDSIHSFFKKMAAKYPRLNNHSLTVLSSKGDVSWTRQLKLKIWSKSASFDITIEVSEYQKWSIRTSPFNCIGYCSRD